MRTTATFYESHEPTLSVAKLDSGMLCGTLSVKPYGGGELALSFMGRDVLADMIRHLEALHMEMTTAMSDSILQDEIDPLDFSALVGYRNTRATAQVVRCPDCPLLTRGR